MLLAVAERGQFDFISKLPTTPAPTQEPTWDLVLLLRGLPVIDPQLADHARLVAPGARIVQVLGPWCEGEERTGRVLDGIERVFWHELQAWWEQKIASPSDLKHSSHRYAIRVDSDDQSMREAILAALAPYGAVLSQEAPTGCPSTGVFVGSQLDGREASRLWRFCREMRAKEARVVVLLDFPRPELVQSALEIGATEVLGKPIDAEQLHSALMGATASAANRPIDSTQPTQRRLAA